jgi:hypothetical protein
LDTDHHVVRLLRDRCHVSPSQLANDVLLVTEWTWRTAMSSIGNNERSSGFRHVVRALTDRGADDDTRRTMFRTIWEWKHRFILQTLGIDDASGHCQFLPCRRRCDRGCLRMNRMLYCNEHSGLALFNGMRHGGGSIYNCMVCPLFNIMALKTTVHPSDVMHIDNFLQMLQMPFVDQGTHAASFAPVRLRRFCVSKMHSRVPFRTSVFTGESYNRPLPLYVDRRGNEVPVPRFSFVALSQSNLVLSWVRLEEQRLHTGAWTPITDPAEMHRILTRLGPRLRGVRMTNRGWDNWEVEIDCPDAHGEL